ncbi:non-POU domain-containing octamer-binding protein isoform X3 [Octopus sinensis]|uniref:Non-POU domain-containing octamer-binding protein isoform X3 n=1 Tax=Octopus sinensis TaxID=2607531 RepID=A0A7E6FRU4_9MOLL|nr:non-POU domain-containing octamer-binding protein isoform X3 [Octopus sinensis]
MAGGFNKGKQTDNNPGKNKPDSIKQEMMSPNSRGGGGGNTGSSNDKGKSSNERSLHSGSKSHQHHQQHQQQHNSQGGGGGNLQEGKGDVSGLSAASAAALSTRDEKKFTGRCRLFVGNLTPDITEDDFRKLFQPYGEISEVYVNASKGFGFIRLDYRHNAEAAKAALDGMQRKGRTLRVRYASLGSALKVKNLSQHVSNELLHQAFSQFGEVERAVVIVDDRGRPTGEGIVEFARKPGAQAAYKRITEGVFLLSSAPRPVTVEPLDQKDEEDGYPEKFINKTDAYKKDRESEPRFAPPGSFEYEFGLRWKELEELEKQQHEGVKKAMEESRLKLEDEMENAMFEQQAEMIRQDLLRQQEELRRLEEIRQQEQIRRRQELEMRYPNRRQDEERRRQEDDRRRTDLLLRSQEIRRRQMGQESMGRDRPGDMMGRQGGSPAMNDNQQRGRNTNTGAPPLPPPPPPPAAMGLDRPGQNQVKMNQSVPNRMRQSRYDQPGDNSFGGTDNYGSAGMGSSAASAMGGGGGPPISSGQMGGGPNGPPSLFNSNMGGNMPGAGNSGMRGGGGGGGGGGGSGGGSGGAGGGSSGSGNSADRGNMMDRRRENANREDYAEMKRMRRY